MTTVDSKGQVQDGGVRTVDDNKIVTISISSVVGPGRKLVRPVNVSVSDFLKAVRTGSPVPVGSLGTLVHPSKFAVNVDGKFLLLAALRKEGLWRRKLYGGYNSIAKAEKRRLLSSSFDGSDRTKGIADPLQGKQPLSLVRFWARGSYHDPKQGKRYSATIDHDPAVVEHWNDSGRLGRQAGRIAFFSKPPFEILPHFLNSSEGSGGARLEPEVGPDFRGPGES